MTALEWYQFLGRLNEAVIGPIDVLTQRINVPMASAILFGLLGATAPCQLTTNLGAMAFVSRNGGEGRPLREALAYVMGKVLIYSLAGGAVIFAGVKLQAAAIPVVVIARKLMGPLMLVLGLGFLGLLRLPGSMGVGLVGRLQSKLSGRGAGGAFLLGIVFSFTFCPTLFWLLFGLTVPLALQSPVGWSYPGLFAVGTGVPLLAFASLFAAGSELAGRWMRRVGGMHRVAGRIAGVVFLVAGVNDTLTYWGL
jgi:cytochrome c biogenesis protein CcdA